MTTYKPIRQNKTGNSGEKLSLEGLSYYCYKEKILWLFLIVIIFNCF